MPAGVVIAGAGQGGFQVAASLRSEGYDSAITLIGEEPGLPYQRPPLSKAFMAGKQEIEAARLRPEAFYRDQRIDLLMGERAVHIDHANRRVELASGGHVPYSHLVLATGARNRLLPLEREVCYLRTREEAIGLRERLEGAREILIIGGGFIGLEIAAVARSLGKRVLVVEAQGRLMARVVAPVLSEFYRDLHLSQGVEFVFGTAEREIAEYRADLVVAGIGVLPNVELAESCGLAVADGIVVDEYLRTANPDIYAIGDCASHPNRYAGGRTRIESVQNAVDQARSVAAGIVGRPHPYDAVPWFWTDQFHIKLQMVGLSQGCDRSVARGNPESEKFSVFYFRQNRLIAIDSINRPADHMVGRKLLAAGTRLTPEQARDLDLDLRELV
jgi:3-phenylpropionate/trans-cinnamate dioxygenase ferredoxin reductase subunit